MNVLPEQCPLCAEKGDLVITRFRCVACNASVEGEFETRQPTAFAALSPEQLQFLEVFVKCEGKLNRMEAELDLSYPTIRTRLTEIIRRMGYEPGKEDPEPRRKPLSEADRRGILDELDAGKLTLEQAMGKLNGPAAAGQEE
jgi:hypothetical protein